jgi:hypothetical protein
MEFFMKKLMMMVSTFGLMAMAMPAAAGGWGDWGNSATSFANGGGSISGFIDASKGKIKVESDLETLSRSDTQPTYGAGTAELNQLGTMSGRDRNFVEGVLVSNGETNVGAKVGRYGEYAGTETAGFNGMLGEAFGDYSMIKGSGLSKSNEESVAVDTPWGGYDSAKAQQLTITEISGYASGNDSAGVAVSAASESLAKEN